MPSNYQNGKVYMIWSPRIEKIYVGSTTQKLSQRMSKHRNSHKAFKEGKMNYITSFDILELGDAKIELIENFPCNSKEELSAREGFYIRKEDCVNKQIAGRTRKECGRKWIEENPEKVREKHKRWYDKHREKILEDTKKYRKENPEKTREIQRNYYQRNIDKYRERNRIKNKIRVRCSCGVEVGYTCFSRHKKTQKHKQTLLNSYNIFNHL